MLRNRLPQTQRLKPAVIWSHGSEGELEQICFWHCSWGLGLAERLYLWMEFCDSAWRLYSMSSILLGSADMLAYVLLITVAETPGGKWNIQSLRPRLWRCHLRFACWQMLPRFKTKSRERVLFPQPTARLSQKKVGEELEPIVWSTPNPCAPGHWTTFTPPTHHMLLFLPSDTPSFFIDADFSPTLHYSSLTLPEWRWGRRPCYVLPQHPSLTGNFLHCAWLFTCTGPPPLISFEDWGDPVLDVWGMDGERLFLWTMFSFWKEYWAFHVLDLKPLEGHNSKWENISLSLGYWQKLKHNEYLLLLLAHVSLAFVNNSSWPLGVTPVPLYTGLCPGSCVACLGQSWAYRMFSQQFESDGATWWENNLDRLFSKAVVCCDLPIIN